MKIILLLIILTFKTSFAVQKNRIFIGKRYPNNLSLSSGWNLSYFKMDTDFKNDLKSIQIEDSDKKLNLGYLKYNEDLIGFGNEELGDSLNSNSKNHFYGGMGKISKRINLKDSLYFEPTGKIQSMAVFRRNMNENYGDYNVDLDNLNGVLNTVYVGAGIGKQYFEDENIIDFLVTAGLKQDINSIDEDLEERRENSKDRNERSREVGMSGAIGNPTTGVSVYTGYKYFFSEENSWKVTAGVSYMF